MPWSVEDGNREPEIDPAEIEARKAEVRAAKDEWARRGDLKTGKRGVLDEAGLPPAHSGIHRPRRRKGDG